MGGLGVDGGWNVLCTHEPPPSGSLQSWFSWYFSQWFWIFAPFSYSALRLYISDYYSPHKHDVYCCLAFKIWRKRIFICINPRRPQRLIRIWVGRNCPRQQAQPPHLLLHNPATSFVFCLYVFVMLNVIESTPTCLHRFGLDCVGSPGFERKIWTREVLLCRFVCYTHVPFLYNRFSVHVWALGIADLIEELFVIERDRDNWSRERNKVYCHSIVLGRVFRE